MNKTIAIFALAAAVTSTAVTARASTFTISGSGGSFTIQRSGGTSAAETVHYRTVPLSAFPGQNYTATNGVITFAAGQTATNIAVSARSPSADAYKYQTGTTRSYRFELMDEGGFGITNETRSVSSGLVQFKNDKVSKSVTDLVKFSGSNFSSGMDSGKYLDVSYTPPSGDVQGSGKTLEGYVLIDDSYDYAQKPATVATSNLIITTGTTASYLNSLGYKIHATVCFTEKERDDGYQYLQIVAGNSAASYDTGADPNGSVRDPTNSVYKVCFELADGSNAEGKAYFPHRGTTSSEFSLSTGKLWQQKYKSGYSGSGAVAFPANTSYITTRFDAGGDNDDTWGYKDLFVRMALVDDVYPTLYNNNAIAVSPGPYCKGNDFYISVSFNEIVNSAGSKTIRTTWGTADYHSGDGSNVITFRGTVNAAVGTTLAITNCPCNFTDLAGNYFQGSLTKTFSGTAVAASYAYPISYDLGGGMLPENAPTNYTYDATVSLVRPTRTGYTFDGWTGPNGSTPQKSVTISSWSHGPRSYIAHWTANTYTVRFDANDGTGTVKNQKFTYNVAGNLSACSFSRICYEFVGWSTNENGAIVYADRAAVSNLTAEANGTVTLYAVWNLIATPWTVLQMQLNQGGIVSLTNNVTAEANESPLTITNAVMLDLNGHTLDAAGKFGAIKVLSGGDLTLTNSVSESGVITGGNANYGGGVYVDGSGAFTLNGGTISGNTADEDGGGVYVDGSGAFTLNGGTISGNTARDYGGGVYLASGTFTMTGGEISGNTAYAGGGVFVDNGMFTMSGGAISLNAASDDGGGVYVEAGGAFTMIGGTISNNTADGDGGGVYVDGGTFTMTGGTISGNMAGEDGGGVFVYSGMFAMTGGTIFGNTASYDGGGVFVWDTFSVSGSPVVSGNTNSVGAANNVYLHSGYTITMDGLSAGASIGVTTETVPKADNPVAFTTGAAAGDSQYFFCDNADYEIAVDVNNELCIRIPDGLTSWMMLQARLDEGGVVTLSEDCFAKSYDATLVITNIVTLDLGGHTIDAKGKFGVISIAEGGNLTLTNSLSGTGVITGGRADCGGGVYVSSGTFTMTGGTISGNTADGDGGGVYVSSGTFTMAGGMISGNMAGEDGGGVFVNCNDFIMAGGEISGNKVSNDGGGVYMDGGTLIVSGSPVVSGNNNSVGVANNVYLHSGCTIVMTSLSAGASIGVMPEPAPTVDNPITITSGATEDGRQYFFCDNADYEIAVDVNNELCIRIPDGLTPWMMLQSRLDEGGVVTLLEDCFAKSYDATLVITNAVTLDLNGHMVDAKGKFGVITIASGGDLTLTNSFAVGAITGGYAEYGGGVYVNYGTFTMAGGEISGNHSNYGGGVFVDNGAFTMTGGEISGNTADEHGGGVFVYSGMFAMTGGTISGNTASDDGGGVFVWDVFSVSGSPVVSGNTNSVGAANNVYLHYGYTITMDGLSAGASIGVTTETVPKADNPVAFATGASEGDGQYFFSDIPRCHVEYADGELRLASGMVYPAYLYGATENVKNNWVTWAGRYGANTSAEYEGHFLLGISPATTIPEGGALLKVVQFNATARSFHIEIGSDVPGYRFFQPKDADGEDDPTLLGNGYAVLELAMDLPAFAPNQTIPQIVRMPVPVAIDATTGHATVDFDLGEFLAQLYPEVPQEWRDEVTMPSPLFLRPAITTIYPDDYTDFIYLLVAEP